MGVWVNPPLQQVVFRLGYPVDLGLVRRASNFQKSHGFFGHVEVKNDLRRGGAAVPHYYLVSPEDPHFLIELTHTDAVFKETRYTDWAEFRAKVLRCLKVTPVPEFSSAHDFIGLACVDRLKLFPTDDKSLPLERYLSMNLKGPGRFSEEKFQRVEWITDYQLDGRSNHLMRFEVKQEPVDDEGLEHLLVVVDRRIVDLDETPVDEFLDMAHIDTRDAFESLLEPEYLKTLKYGDQGNAH